MTTICSNTDTGSFCGQLTSESGKFSQRRIYINESSFLDLACSGSEAAHLVFSMTARNVVLKAVHHIFQEAVLLAEEVSPSVEQFASAVLASWSSYCSEAIGLMVWRPRDPRMRMDIYPLLNEGESIVATCYFSNYYTFATGSRAAEAMFSDTNEIAELKQLIRSGKDYSDLTLVRGNCLFLLDQAIGTGKDRALHYERARKETSPLTAAELEMIKGRTLREIRSDLERLMQPLSEETRGECLKTSLCKRVMDAADYAFSRGILKSRV